MADISESGADVSTSSEQLEQLMARLGALEARVQELEDEREIRDLLSRYGFTADTCNDEAFVELYTEDGAMKLRMPNAPAEDPFVVWQGHEGIREFISSPARHDAKLVGKSLHVNDNMVTHVDGDEAVANSYQFAIAVGENGVRLLSAGNNQWQLRKIDGNWHIKERRGSYLGDEFFTTNMDATPS